MVYGLLFSGDLDGCFRYLVPFCLIWTLWRERNNRIFENMERTESHLFELFSNTLYDWTTVWGYPSSILVISFLDSLHISLIKKKKKILYTYLQTHCNLSPFCVHTLRTQSGFINKLHYYLSKIYIYIYI
jgi:hypothetical protein